MTATPLPSPHPGPYLLRFPRMGTSESGYLSVVENTDGLLPFSVQRVFWTYDTPADSLRGGHAHRRTAQVLIALCGQIVVETERPDGQRQTFTLAAPDHGLYVPPGTWHTMRPAPGAVQLVLASLPYEEADYLRDYASFRASY